MNLISLSFQTAVHKLRARTSDRVIVIFNAVPRHAVISIDVFRVRLPGSRAAPKITVFKLIRKRLVSKSLEVKCFFISRNISFQQTDTLHIFYQLLDHLSVNEISYDVEEEGNKVIVWYQSANWTRYRSRRTLQIVAPSSSFARS